MKGTAMALWVLQAEGTLASQPDVTFMKLLSMFWKRLASMGSCLTMSPLEKTASMYVHMFWTASHCSICIKT